MKAKPSALLRFETKSRMVGSEMSPAGNRTKSSVVKSELA
jgi:hypothetical protein